MDRDIPARQDTDRMLRELCLMDDGFFSVSFSGDRENTELMLRIILGRDDHLDIAARDREGNLYDIEIQRSRDKAERKRARY